MNPARQAYWNRQQTTVEAGLRTARIVHEVYPWEDYLDLFFEATDHFNWTQHQRVEQTLKDEWVGVQRSLTDY